MRIAQEISDRAFRIIIVPLGFFFFPQHFDPVGCSISLVFITNFLVGEKRLRPPPRGQ